ncbi:hypothetical protein [Xanthomonas bonasiae]|uniref:hypothetical protein n=1 Tax=Xanthomonas bonasiae TaxID=2810351 RepID=UPI00197D1523|nr:hypothetical protein [Xanthomonas bonasiae]MBN6113145.1 hypothetical protein [Xanthomonas bonasiae]
MRANSDIKPEGSMDSRDTKCGKLLASALVLFGCAQHLAYASHKATIAGGDAAKAILSCESKKVSYIPIPSLPSYGYKEVYISENSTATEKLKPWPREAGEINKLLTNISATVSEYSASKSGGIQGWFSASEAKKQYVIDFMKWRAEPIEDIKGVGLGWARVGAGIRVVVNITKGERNASGSLFGLAINAKSNKVSGSISTELIGLDAKEFTQAMPFTTDLTEGNIQSVVEALAIVKAKLYDDSTVVAPNLIAMIECAPLENKLK